MTAGSLNSVTNPPSFSCDKTLAFQGHGRRRSRVPVSNAVLVEVLSEADGILTLKEEQRTTLKDFIEKKIICFTPDWLWQES